MKSARTKACEIPPNVKLEVYERDKGICVICGIREGRPDMHYIPRSLGGLGIKENIVCGCPECHRDYDNGSQYNRNFRNEGRKKIKDYLEQFYPGYPDRDRIFHNKWEREK
jgi:5-methylcytosine-specific restriction endonuclease McrA